MIPTTEIKEVNFTETDNFNLNLLWAKENDYNTKFVIRISKNNRYYISKKDFREEFFSSFGFEKNYNDGNFYKEIYKIKTNSIDMAHFQEAEFVHSEFKKFASKIDELFNYYSDIKNLQKMEDFSPPFRKISLKELELNNPNWIKEYKSENLKEKYLEIEKIKSDIYQEKKILELLTSQGEELEESVLEAFKKINIILKKTEKGDTVDLISEESEPNKFALEITGTRDNIKKSTNKIGQILAFQQKNEKSEFKTILVANCFLDLNPFGRNELITEEALNLIIRLDSLFIDSYSLFLAVKKIENGEIRRESLIRYLKEKTGEFKLNEIKNDTSNTN